MATVEHERSTQRLHPGQQSPLRLASGARLIEIAPDVACLQLSLVNLFLVGPPHGSWVLVDAGLSISAAAIREAAEMRFGRNNPPQAIVLTHGHFDHVGAIEQLLRTWHVPVYAHRLEMPYLTGRSSYPPPDPAVGGGGMAYLSWLYPRGPINLGNRAQPFRDHNSVPHLPDWNWIATPGHTAGHISLWRERDRLLIAGDAVVTTQQESTLAVLLQPQRVCRPPAYYTSDWQAAGSSVKRIAALEPEVLATGHGVPMRGEAMRRELRSLAKNWQWRRPWFGRYVERPAIANAEGVIWVPPPVMSPQLAVLAGLGVGTIAAGLLLSRRR